ncbi:MAG: hypothetical protein K6L75_12905 [Cellvibrionaceae bacterium]
MAIFSKFNGLILTLCFLFLALGCSKENGTKKAENLLEDHKEILDQAKEMEGDMQKALDKRLENIE